MSQAGIIICPDLYTYQCLVHLVKGRTGLTSILANFNGVSIKARWSHDLRLAPDDGNRSVVLVLNKQIQWNTCGLCKMPWKHSHNLQSVRNAQNTQRRNQCQKFLTVQNNKRKRTTRRWGFFLNRALPLGGGGGGVGGLGSSGAGASAASADIKQAFALLLLAAMP